MHKVNHPYFLLVFMAFICGICASNITGHEPHILLMNGSEDPEKSASCPGGWEATGDRCLLIKVDSTRDHMSYLDAQAQCLVFNGGKGGLVSIHSQEENDFIYSKVREGSGSELTHVWIGMAKIFKGYPYVWEDGTPVDYMHWDANEPNDKEGAQNCLRLYGHNGFWDDFTCSGFSPQDEFHGYVCQYETPQIDSKPCNMVPNAEYPGCCAAGDVFAIIFGIIILIAIVVGVFGYLYYFRWGQRLPWK